jgi:hypothetical protein
MIRPSKTRGHLLETHAVLAEKVLTPCLESGFRARTSSGMDSAGLVRLQEQHTLPGITTFSSMVQGTVAVNCRRTVAEIGLASSFSNEEMGLSYGMGGILVLQSMMSYDSPHASPSSQSASSMQNDGGTMVGSLVAAIVVPLVTHGSQSIGCQRMMTLFRNSVRRRCSALTQRVEKGMLWLVCISQGSRAKKGRRCGVYAFLSAEVLRAATSSAETAASVEVESESMP